MSFVSTLSSHSFLMADPPCSNGVLMQPARHELARAVVGRGTVVRYMRDGSTQMLFVTGKLWLRVLAQNNRRVAVSWLP